MERRGVAPHHGQASTAAATATGCTGERKQRERTRRGHRLGEVHRLLLEVVARGPTKGIVGVLLERHLAFGYPGGTLPTLSTSAGDLQFSLFFNGVGAGTFSAVLNPVPAPGAIALLGLAGLAKRRRR